MDRNEIALRFAVAYLTTPHAPHVVPPWTEFASWVPAEPPRSVGREGLAKDAANESR